MANVQVKQTASDAMIAEGSFTALVQVYGYEFAVHYINSEVTLFGTQSLAYDRRPRWQVQGAAKAVRQWAADTIAALGNEFSDRHVALYADA